MASLAFQPTSPPLAAPAPPAFSLKRAASADDWAQVAEVRVRTGHPGVEPADHAPGAITFLLERRAAPIATTRTTYFHLLKAHMLQCLLVDADGLVMAVREPEIGFHCRMLNMEILSGPEPYPDEERRVLMGLDIRRHAQALSKRLPIIAIAGNDPGVFMSTGRVAFSWDSK